MDGTGVNAIREMAERAAGQNVVVEVGNALLSTIPLSRLPKEHAPDEPKTLCVNTLSALIAYVEENRDEFDLSACMVHVVGPQRVDLLSTLQERGVRFCYMRAACTDLARDMLNLRMLEANVMIQSRVADGGHKAQVLKILGGVADESEVKVADDGRTQSVTTRAGVKVTLGDEVGIPNPVMLAPIRTFREIEQPLAPFIFRLERSSSGPIASLHEADGGAWELEAIERIAHYLRENLKVEVSILQ